MVCEHTSLHSGGAQYLRDSGRLRLVLLCDLCGAERAELGTIAYAPQPRRLVVHLAELVARELGLDEARIARVRFAAMVCGAGREEIPAEILAKRGPLSQAEWVEVQRQPRLAAALLSDVSLEDIREWILCHRERPDGSGYPRGLTAEQIPLEARILAVADAYAAMLSDRPHRSARDHDDACAELVRNSGTQFDPRVVEAFLTASLHRDPRLERTAA